jgi:DNA-binding MarR family transcriptional regulator
MQTLAVVGNQPPEVVTRGDVRLLQEESMFDRDPRWADDPRERDDDPRDRDMPERDRSDPRDVFLRELDLPRGPERERVFDGDREYTLRGSESRTLATVGAFRVVPAQDLRDRDDRPLDPRNSELRHLREQGLIDTVRMDGRRDVAVFLTDRGHSLLEAHRRERDHDPRDDDPRGDRRQEFYSGLVKPRELEHDAHVFQAYLHEVERLLDRDCRVDHVVLDYELKREYQEWLHERDRGVPDADGRPDRTAEEIARWALEHDLPYFDDHVRFPDLRIEYLSLDGHHDHRDVEVTTVHYRGGHAAAVKRSGFSRYRGSTARTGKRGRPFDPHLAEELL